MNQALLDRIESEQFRKDGANFGVGDSVRVHTKVVEGDKDSRFEQIDFNQSAANLFMMTRRSFLTSSTCLGATAAFGCKTVNSGNQSLKTEHASGITNHESHQKRIRLGIATYSYWHFKTAKVPIETVIDKASEIGVEGLDILHRQMDIPEREPLTAAHRSYLQKNVE